MKNVILFFEKNLEFKKVKKSLVFVAIFFFFFFLAENFLFFKNLNSLSSDYSWGDVSWIHQAFYNFVNQRPLQTSVYYYSGEGCIGNPFGYANQLAMHINFTPYLFSIFYKFFPGLNTLYLTVIGFNTIGFLAMLLLILKKYSRVDIWLRYSLVVVFLFGGNFFWIINYKTLFPLYQGVFIMLMFYTLINDRKLHFIISSLLFLLISDDSALFGLSFSFFLYFFKKEKFYSYFLFLVSFIYILIITLFLSPLAKFEIKTIHKASSDIIIRLQNVVNGVYELNFADINSLLVFILFIYLCIFLLTKKMEPKVFAKSLMIIFLAPASHWFISFVNGGGHHLMPVYAMIMIGVVFIIGNWQIERNYKVEYYRILFLFLIFFKIFKSNFVYSMSMLSIQMPSRAQAISNEKVLEKFQSISKEKSLVYLTNRGMDAYAVARNDVWRFPSYFNEADYLLIQKNAEQLFFEPRVNSLEFNCKKSILNFGSISTKDLEKAIHCGRDLSGGALSSLDLSFIVLLKKELVELRKTHKIEFDDENIILFKKINSTKIYMPESSLGFSFLNNLKPYLEKMKN